MENLDALLTKIRNDGVEPAKAEAAAIVAAARKEAEELLAKAKTEAAAVEAKAKVDAERLAQGAEATIRQAARDVVLKLEQDVTALFERTLGGEVSAAMAPGPMVEKLVKEAVEAYLKDGEVAVVAGPELAAALKGKLAAAGQVTVVTNALLGTGFQVRLAKGRVEHDFTGAAVTDALAALLRPQLAKLLKD